MDRQGISANFLPGNVPLHKFAFHTLQKALWQGSDPQPFRHLLNCPTAIMSYSPSRSDSATQSFQLECLYFRQLANSTCFACFVFLHVRSSIGASHSVCIEASHTLATELTLPAAQTRPIPIQARGSVPLEDLTRLCFEVQDEHRGDEVQIL